MVIPWNITFITIISRGIPWHHRGRGCGLVHQSVDLLLHVVGHIGPIRLDAAIQPLPGGKVHLLEGCGGHGNYGWVKIESENVDQYIYIIIYI